jgi:hypothetical protein
MNMTSKSSKNTPNLGGRPSKYTPEIQKKAEKYIEMPLFEKYKVQKVVKDEIVEVELSRPSGIPSIAGLAVNLGVSRETIYTWGETHRQFLDTLEELKSKQEYFLEYHGLTRGYDSSFAKFIAVNVTNYRDKIETTNTNKEIKIDADKEDLEL